MKAFKILIGLLFIACLADAQVSDGTLLSEINSKVYGKPYFPKNHGDVLTDLVNSKPSLLGSYANPSWITSLAGSKITGNVFTLTNTGTSGVATYSGGTLNIPNYSITLTTTGTSGAATLIGGTLNIPNYTISGSAGGDLSGSYPNPTVIKINGTSLAGLSTGLLKNTTGTGVPSIAVSGTDYQAPITLTTTGSSGAATFIGNTLNIPNYSGISGLTTTYLPLATSPTTLGNSEITKNATGFYFINTSVNGNAEFSVNNSSTTSNATSYLTAQAGTSEVDLISYGQNTSTPGLAELKNNSGDLKITTSTSGKVLVSNGASVSPSRSLHAYFIDGTNTASLAYPFRATKALSSGTPSIGIGTGIELETQTGTSTFKVGNTIESITTSVTGGSESFDLVFRGMTNGSTSEKFRLTSYGALLTGSTAYSTVALGSIGSSQNDYAIGNGTIFYITPTAGINITGIANPHDGQVICIVNLSGSFGIGFPDNSGSSSSGNRFAIPGSFTLAAGNSCQFAYVNGAWRLISKTN